MGFSDEIVLFSCENVLALLLFLTTNTLLCSEESTCTVRLMRNSIYKLVLIKYF